MNSTSNIEIVNTIDALNLEQDKTNLGASVLLARSEVPESHRRYADSYMILKKLFGMPAVNPSINVEEKKYLAKYDFNSLEFSTIKQVNEELSIMKKWNESGNKELKEACEKLIAIRVKELKGIIASKYVKISNEIYNGYKAIERYLEEISKYNEN
ncbi:MAG: hypothetical protein PHX18_08940 [Candidatus Gastranaerophilales bacterium]|nr:hypothetical protein [Candidatus Gastranaerophilales bacterium]